MMDPVLNPYSPGAGLRPPALVGRDSEIRAAAGLVERTRLDLTTRGIVLTGLRGVGKTVLLQQLRAQLRSADWFEVTLEARSDDGGARCTPGNPASRGPGGMAIRDHRCWSAKPAEDSI